MGSGNRKPFSGLLTWQTRHTDDSIALINENYLKDYTYTHIYYQIYLLFYLHVLYPAEMDFVGVKLFTFRPRRTCKMYPVQTDFCLFSDFNQRP